MNWSQFKHKVKRDMPKHEVEQDFMELWNTLEPRIDRLNRKKKRRRGFLFFLILGGTVISTLVGIYSLQQGTKLTIKEPAFISENQKLHEHENSKFSDSVKGTALSIADKNVKTLKEKFNTPLPTVPEYTKTSTNSKFKSVIYQDKVNFSAPVSKISWDTKNDFDYNPYLEHAPNEQKESNRKRSNLPIHHITEIEQQDSQLAFDLKRPVALDLLSILPIKSIEYKNNAPLYFLESKFEPVLLKPNNPNRPTIKFNTYVYATQRRLSSKGKVDNTLSQIREGTETPLETSQVEMLFEFLKKGNFAFATGLSLTQVVERLNFIDVNEEIKEVDGVEFQVPNLAGGRIDIYGKIDQTFQQNTSYSTFNRYRFIDIPVLVNYKFHLSKWKLLLEAGPYININLNAKGNILTEQLSFQNLEEQNVLKNTVGVSLGMNARVQRSIGKKIQLQFGPSIRWIHNSISHENNGINQTYNLIGGTAGLVFKL